MRRPAPVPDFGKDVPLPQVLSVEMEKKMAEDLAAQVDRLQSPLVVQILPRLPSRKFLSFGASLISVPLANHWTRDRSATRDLFNFSS
jgi:hypothetical protein